MTRVNSFLKVSFVVSVALGLMGIFELPIDQQRFSYDGPILIKFLIAFITWILIYWANYKADAKLSFINGKLVFHIISFLTVLLFSVLVMYAQNILFKAPKGMVYSDPILINQTLFSGCWITLITRCFKIAYDYFESSRKAAISNEKLLKENAKSHFALLNQQVNPHFLFNSLNTIVDLINKDNQPAISYVKEFASVYRYVLTHGTKDFVSIAEELDFIQSYLTVLKHRFQEKLIVNIDIPEEKHQQEIPPLTLQTLIENAIKHNEVSNTFPLQIDICFSDNTIIVKNKIRFREKAPSSGLGLNNLASRMEFLTGKNMNFGRTNGQFIVTVPICE